MDYIMITGASSGIGKATAIEFARMGHNLVLIARSTQKLNSLKHRLEHRHRVKIEVITQDLAQVDAAIRVFEETKKRGLVVTGLINNAGLGDLYPFSESDWDKQKELLDVNIVALTQLCHVYAKEMKQRGEGHIINVSSVAAFFAGPNMASYYASKAFVISFSEALADELKGSGVHVSAICPSPTKTNFEVVANMKYSNMFTFKRPMSPQTVARQFTDYFSTLDRCTIIASLPNLPGMVPGSHHGS